MNGNLSKNSFKSSAKVQVDVSEIKILFRFFNEFSFIFLSFFHEIKSKRWKNAWKTLEKFS